MAQRSPKRRRLTTARWPALKRSRTRIRASLRLTRTATRSVNGLQIPALLEELTRLMEETDTPSELQWLFELRDVAERCRATPHTYLKLLGD